PLPQGCDATTCLHTGFVADISICGDSNIAEGEDCDDGGVENNDGCSSVCLNEGTDELTPANANGVPLDTISPSKENTVVDINLSSGTYFTPNTYYRAFLFDEIKGKASKKGLTDLNWDFDNTNDSYSWSFKTKDTFCNPDTVQVVPAQKIIYNISATQNYEASIYGSPDSCNPRGEKLNPYLYNWSWFSTVPQVADFIAPFPANRWPGCGNEKIETGEDCDDGNNLSGDGCSSVCVNEGTTKDMGLVSHWEFEEGDDVFAYDSAGVNKGNLIGGPVWATGKFGGALDFDGVDDYVDIGNNESLAIKNEITISAWVKLNKNPNCDEGYNNWRYIFVKDGSYDAILEESNEITWSVQTTNNNKMRYKLPSINSNKWVFLSFIYKSSLSASDNAKAYIDGVEVPPNYWENHTGYGEIVANTNPLWINHPSVLCPNGGGNFPGLIDDVRIYNKALTGAQIQGIMSQKNYLCDNGVIDFGEDCDGSPFPAGCGINSCLHTGTMGVCGNGIVETGEDCDDNNAVNEDGCSNVCLHEGTEVDSFIDFYQTATTKSPGKTNIQASVNYCSNNPTITCGVAGYGCVGGVDTCVAGLCNSNPLIKCPNGDTDCNLGTCSQTTGSGELEVVCGFSNDDSCSKGVCASGNVCTNNSSVACTTANETVNCNLTAAANTTCNFAVSNNHTCSIAKWGGNCSVSTSLLCYSASDCPDTEFCQPKTDCNYCANNTSFECRTANNLVSGSGNSDCQLGVGYDSCCYSRPIIKSESPDPNFFNPLLNPLALNCNNNATQSSSDDYCSAFGASAACQTYSCQDTNSDSTPDTCSSYGRCNNENGLIGHWRLDESPAVNGNTIFDSSSSVSNGTLSADDAANKTAIGKIAGALNFDGSSDYVDLPDGLSNFTNGFSVSVWAYPTVVQNWQRFIDIGNGSSNNNIIFTRDGNSSNLIFDVYSELGFGRVTAFGAIELNKWQHFSATINNIGDAKIYKNGLLIASGPVVVPQNIVRTKNYIGRSNFVEDGYYQGLMDDVRIYNRTLAPDEVVNLYNSHCLSNNDCAAGSTCDKTCRDDSQCNGITCGACRNAQVNITFDKIMDPTSFSNDGVCSNNSSQSCAQNSNCSGGICLKNIRLGVKYDNAAINQKNCPSGYYTENGLVYQPPKGFIAKFVAKVKTWFSKLLGIKETIAAEYWCAIPGTITSFNKNKRTTAIFTPQGLKDNLFEDGVTYRVTVKSDVKRAEGVRMGKDDSSDFQYEFKAGDIECSVETVDVYVED
ncbi:MAG: LamG-like jellyroll fold domain-containing protein, partial [bacterium]